MTTSRPASHGADPRLRLDRPPREEPPERTRPSATSARGRSFTYADLDRRVDAMAAHLASLGIGRGDRVGVLAHNGVEYFDIQFACARTGAICVLLNWRLTVSELEYILSDSSPKLLVHDVEFADAAARAAASAAAIAHLLEIDGGAADSAYEQALAAGAGHDRRTASR